MDRKKCLCDTPHSVQVNLYQKLLFLHQLTHNMTTVCSLNYKFNTWKFQAQTWGEHVVYRYCFWHSEQFLYTTSSPHVLQKEELLIKIYLYHRWILQVEILHKPSFYYIEKHFLYEWIQCVFLVWKSNWFFWEIQPGKLGILPHFLVTFLLHELH